MKGKGMPTIAIITGVLAVVAFDLLPCCTLQIAMLILLRSNIRMSPQPPTSLVPPWILAAAGPLQ